MKSLIKNKRGDIPITILVIGVVAVCFMAIFSFYVSDRFVKNTFNSIYLVEKTALQKEQISLHKSLGYDNDEIKNLFNITKDIQGDYILLEQGNIKVRYNIDQ